MLVAAVSQILLQALVISHPEIEAQLANVTDSIVSSPRNAELYLRRGHLHRVHRDWQAGLADFRQAEALDPELHRAARAVGRLLLEAGKPKQALPHLEQFLQRQPGDPEGQVLRGRALGQLGATLKAAADFDAALPKLRRPTPELFIERAKILVAGGKQYRSRALTGLSEGIERLGNLYTLHRYAAELEINDGRPEAALQRAHQLLAKSVGKLSWQVFEAELLTSIDKFDEARAAYLQALEIIASLPPHRRRTPTIVNTEQSIRSALAALDSDG